MCKIIRPKSFHQNVKKGTFQQFNAMNNLCQPQTSHTLHRIYKIPVNMSQN